MRRILTVFSIIALAAMALPQTIVVGSKKFTESYVLGEIAKKVLSNAGLQVEHKQGMGATAIVWGALKTGDITFYPEYTGTISEEILKAPGATREAMTQKLASFGIGMSPDLGFNDAYGLVMRRQQAKELGITKISDLKNRPQLRCGITHELLGRADGWNPLIAKYGLKFDDVKGIDHALGYAALYAGQVDIKDCYTTDAEIKKYDLVVLQDDLKFFPLYRAVFLYRLNAPNAAIDAIAKLAGTIDEEKMIAMNDEASKTKDYAEAASLYFAAPGKISNSNDRKVVVRNHVITPTLSELFRQKVLPELLQHLKLVIVSMLLAIAVGVPLGIWASKPGVVSQAILGTTGVIQTIPSLALLALLVPIPFFGISFTTAVVALFLYSLLPIVRNTAAGIAGIPLPLREAASVLGLEPGAQMKKIYLPMALPMILAGIKTSAVINVGTATLAALIGQGGFGEPIVSGLSLNDSTTILWGAIPAAILAIVVQVGFDQLERKIVPKGLRIRGEGR